MARNITTFCQLLHKSFPRLCYDKLQAKLVVHDSLDAGHTLKLLQGICNAGEPALAKRLQGIKDWRQPPQGKKLFHPLLVCSFEPVHESSEVEASVHESDTQLRISTLQASGETRTGIARNSWHGVPDSQSSFLEMRHVPMASKLLKLSLEVTLNPIWAAEVLGFCCAVKRKRYAPIIKPGIVGTTSMP